MIPGRGESPAAHRESGKNPGHSTLIISVCLAVMVLILGTASLLLGRFNRRYPGQLGQLALRSFLQASPCGCGELLKERDLDPKLFVLVYGY